MSKSEDAWKQHHDLLEKYTRVVELRPDLRVTASATGRGVELEIGEARIPTPDRLDPIGRYIWQSTGKRNVSTMRELAQAIIEACDFVEESNPKWASHPKVSRFEAIPIRDR